MKKGCTYVASDLVLLDPEWSFLKRGVPVFRVDSRGYVWLGKVHLHRLLITTNANEEVDHINGNKLDNRISNLRSVSHHLNCLNKGFNKKRGAFPKGVYQCGSGRYVATIMWKNKRTHLGTFDTIEEASQVYQKEYLKRTEENYGTEITRELQSKRDSGTNAVTDGGWERSIEDCTREC